MYILMMYSIAEMSSTMPHTGGAYSFGRSAMGPWGGYVTGLAETIEYVITTAVVGYLAGLYADAITDDLFGFTCRFGCGWCSSTLIFVGFELRWRRGIVPVRRRHHGHLACRARPSSSYSRCSPVSSRRDNLSNIAPEEGNNTFHTVGCGGVLLAFRSRSGSSSVSRSCRWPRRRLTPHRGHPARIDLGMVTLLVTGSWC